MGRIGASILFLLLALREGRWCFHITFSQKLTSSRLNSPGLRHRPEGLTQTPLLPLGRVGAVGGEETRSD